MYEKEKLIKEERTREATKKGLMGLDGKLGCILRYLGHPIISETGSWFQSNEGEDFHGHLFDDENDRPVGERIEGGDNEVDDAGWRGSSQEFAGIKKMEGDGIAQKIGWHFDGLSRGMHLEIKYLSERAELNASWKGTSVFTEVLGELYQYVPGDDWERCINRLYGMAKKLQEKAHREGVEETKVEIEEEKWNFLDNLKKLWGI